MKTLGKVFIILTVLAITIFLDAECLKFLESDAAKEFSYDKALAFVWLVMSLAIITGAIVYAMDLICPVKSKENKS